MVKTKKEEKIEEDQQPQIQFPNLEDLTPFVSLAKEFLPKKEEKGYQCEVILRGTPDMILRILNKD